MKKILLVRTFRSVGTGGPVVPLELLYIASSIEKSFKDKYEIKILDTGIGQLDLNDIEREVRSFSPDIILLNGLIWEADLVHNIAELSKKINQTTLILAQGQLPTLAKGYSLKDKNIDYCIIGEADSTVVELLEALEDGDNLSQIKGIIYKKDNQIYDGGIRDYIEDLDEFGISSSAWDLINIKEYAKYSNWNGSLKEKFYIPILTSRGCPFDCVFCCNKDVIGKKFRARSPKNVFDEIKFLHDKYNVKEIHFFDAVFNYDVERAKEICNLIIDSGLKLSLAFPHGIRADIMNDQLIDLLRRAGTYKLVYGVETASLRLQKEIKKNLDINQVKDIIRKTSDVGIIVGGYFMLGFPTESYEEMQETINFAVGSDLDLAAFFKVTLYKEALKRYYDAMDLVEKGETFPHEFEDFSYYSKKRSNAEISAIELNNVILEAQQRFYLNFSRISRGLLKFPHKIAFLKNLINAVALIIQAYLIRSLASSQSTHKDTKKVV